MEIEEKQPRSISEIVSIVGSLIEVFSMLLFGFVVWTNKSALARLATRLS